MARTKGPKTHRGIVNEVASFSRGVIFILAAFAASAHAQVPDWPERALYVAYDSGDIVYVPTTHQVVIQPKGWNTAPFVWLTNPLGVADNRWPFLDAICDYIEQPVASPGPDLPHQPVCDFPNYVIKP